MPIVPPKAIRASDQSRPPYEIKIAQSKDEVEACYDIRIEVFVVEMGFPHDTEIDDLDPASIQFLLTVQSPNPPSNSTTLLNSHLPSIPSSLNPMNLLPTSLTSSPSSSSSTTSTETSTSSTTATTSPDSPQQPESQTQIPIGTIRYTPASSKLSRLAVLDGHRSHRFGQVLVGALEDYVRTTQRSREEASNESESNGHKVVERDGKKGVEIQAHAATYLLPFYTRLGYTPVGDEFIEEEAPHQKVIKFVAFA